MKKIVVLRANRYGGTMTFFLELCKVIKFTTEDEIYISDKVSPDIIAKLKNYPIVINKIPQKGSNLVLRRTRQIFFLLRNIDRKNTKVIFADWNLILDFFSFLFKNSVSFVHTYPNKKMPNFFRKISSFLFKRMTIITVSDYSIKKIKENWFTDGTEIKKIYNFSNRLPMRKIENKKNTVINTIAHVESYKNPKLWLEIAECLTSTIENVEFNWYGDGSLFEYYASATKKNKQINFLGFESDIETVLRGTNIYLQVSSVESLGISILDAMNMGIPCVVTNTGGMPELVVNNITGFVGDSKKQIVYQLKEIIDNEELYSKMSKNAKKSYDQIFSYEIWKKNILEVIS